MESRTPSISVSAIVGVLVPRSTFEWQPPLWTSRLAQPVLSQRGTEGASGSSVRPILKAKMCFMRTLREILSARKAGRRFEYYAARRGTRSTSGSTWRGRGVRSGREARPPNWSPPVLRVIDAIRYRVQIIVATWLEPEQGRRFGTPSAAAGA